MGKRRKSSKPSRPSKTALPDAVSDNEDGDVIGSNLHGDEVDDFYDEEDNQLSLKLKGRNQASSRNLEDVDDVFGLSDSDDDFMDSNKKKKKKQKDVELAEGTHWLHLHQCFGLKNV
jgi:hypothetical protein